jgi:hypothetical protein
MLIAPATQQADSTSVLKNFSLTHFSFAPIVLSRLGPDSPTNTFNQYHNLPPPQPGTLLRLHCALIV